MILFKRWFKMNGHEKILCAFSQMKKGMMNFVDLAFDFLCLSSVYPTTLYHCGNLMIWVPLVVGFWHRQQLFSVGRLREVSKTWVKSCLTAGSIFFSEKCRNSNIVKLTSAAPVWIVSWVRARNPRQHLKSSLNDYQYRDVLVFGS